MFTLPSPTPARRALRAHATLLTALLAALPGCLQSAAPPHLGTCADAAASGATFGEIGIGTCVSGPVDLAFVHDDATDWLVVANADPFDNFASASVLFIDWSSVDLGETRNALGDLSAAAVPFTGLPGGLGVVERDDARLVLLTDRHSEGSTVTTTDDRVHIIDATDPLQPSPWSGGDIITVGADPGPIAIDPATNNAFIANVTDRTLSVLDTAGTPMAVRDLASAAAVTPGRFYDQDHTGSTATAMGTVTAPASVVDDRWTLEWLEGATHLYVPDAGGLQRWTSGGRAFTPSAYGIELDPADPASTFLEAGAPFLSTDGAFPELLGNTAMLFADQGDLLLSVQGGGGAWTSPAVIAPGGGDTWDAVLDAPAAIVTPIGPVLYYDGRATLSAPGAVGLALLGGNGWVRTSEPLWPNTAWERVEDPFPRADPFSRNVRMWMSLYDGTHWVVGHAESADGLAWSDPEPVITLPDGDAAAPVVAWFGGAYRMWLSTDDGDGWHTSVATSVDGLSWTEPAPLLAIDGFDPLTPPRVAAQTIPETGWRVTGASAGPQVGVVTAGVTSVIPNKGFSLNVASGHYVAPTDVHPDAVSVAPISVIPFGAQRLMYTSVTLADGRITSAVLREEADGWRVAATDLFDGPDFPGTNGRSPVVVADGDALRAWYTMDTDAGVASLASATSADGLTWTAATVDAPAVQAFDAVARVPHAAVPLADGGWRLWYSAYDGSRWRIASLLTDDGVTFTAEPGDGTPWQLGPGLPGTLDDTGARQPAVRVIDGVTHVWYAGSTDGQRWEILHATRADGEVTWHRDTAATPALFGLTGRFSAGGVQHPVLATTASGDDELWFAGVASGSLRVGHAVAGPDGGEHGWYPDLRSPTPGDTLVVATARGGVSRHHIPLARALDGLSVAGTGVTNLRLDADRGFLYVTQGRGGDLANFLTVLDVRDDSEGAFVDSNVMDIEAVVRLDPGLLASGLRDVVVIPGTSRLYATAQNPDALIAIDLSDVVDNAVSEVLDNGTLAVLPLLRVGGSLDPARPFASEDAGVPNDSAIGAANLTLLPDGHTLLVSHYRDNSVIVFDTALGLWGEEVRRIEDVGENPHKIVIDPTGRYAVVANYLGEIEDESTTHGKLAVIDVDPESETYLEVVTWLVNR